MSRFSWKWYDTWVKLLQISSFTKTLASSIVGTQNHVVDVFKVTQSWIFTISRVTRLVQICGNSQDTFTRLQWTLWKIINYLSPWKKCNSELDIIIPNYLNNRKHLEYYMLAHLKTLNLAVTLFTSFNVSEGNWTRLPYCHSVII